MLRRKKEKVKKKVLIFARFFTCASFILPLPYCYSSKYMVSMRTVPRAIPRA